jgi:hypothetical protein
MQSISGKGVARVVGWPCVSRLRMALRFSPR